MSENDVADIITIYLPIAYPPTSQVSCIGYAIKMEKDTYDSEGAWGNGSLHRISG